MSSHRPSQIQYNRVPLATKPVKEQLQTFTVGGTYSGGQTFHVEVDAPSAFLDTSRSYFEFTITPTITATTSLGGRVAFLDGGSHCVIKNYKLTVGNGVAVADDFNEYHKLYNALTDFAPKGYLNGQFSATSGGPISGANVVNRTPSDVVPAFKFIGCPGIPTGTAYTTTHQPLGLLSPSQSKWIPMFLTGALRMSVTLEDAAKAFVLAENNRAFDAPAVVFTAAAADITNVTYTVTNFRYVAHLVYLDNSDIQTYVTAATQGGPLEITYDTFKYNSDSATADGTKNINCQINAKSLKSLLILPRDAALGSTTLAAGDANYNVGSPYLTMRTHQGITNLRLKIGDFEYPNEAITCTIENNSRAYNELMKAMGRLGSTDEPTALPRHKYIAPAANADLTEVATAGGYQADATAFVETLYAIGFDLESFPTETSQDPNISGINTEGSKIMQVSSSITRSGVTNIEFNVYGICDAKLLLTGTNVDVVV